MDFTAIKNSSVQNFFRTVRVNGVWYVRAGDSNAAHIPLYTKKYPLLSDCMCGVLTVLSGFSIET